SALFIFSKVWTGVAGLLVGAVFAGALFLPWFVRNVRQAPVSAVETASLELKTEIPMIISYALFVVFNNLDVLMGYFLLSRADLDTYAASALLPKAVITATFATAQVVLPVVAERRSTALSFRASVVKALVG